MDDLLRRATTCAPIGYLRRCLLITAVVSSSANFLIAQLAIQPPSVSTRRTFDDASSNELRRLGPEPPKERFPIELLPVPEVETDTRIETKAHEPPRNAIPDARHVERPAADDLPSADNIPSADDSPGANGLPGWWDQSVHRPLRDDAVALPISLDSLLTSTLTHSAYVQVIKDIPLIRDTVIIEADADFDWISFIESRWNDVSDPVGSLLTTGNQISGISVLQDRYRDERFTARGGVRRRTSLGGQFEVAQEIGRQTTNSRFFDPPNQGTSRVTVNYTQPLLRGAGRSYNRSLTVLAEIDASRGRDELSQDLQDHLIKVTNAYWQLYSNRGRLLQKRRLLAQAQHILTQLEERSEVDVLLSQIVRARSAVASRYAEIARAETEIRNTESKIRALVNDPALGNRRDHELIPQDRPLVASRELDRVDAIETALKNRPEISLAVKQIKATSVRLKMTKNELLPSLNVILETYVSGLRDNYDIGQAWQDQFRLGEPTFSAGVQYELPLRNRAAKARYQRRRLELRQLEADLKATMETLRQEVEVAVAEVMTTHQEMQANHRSMQAASVEANYIFDRWQLLPGSDRGAGLLLDNLITAQERVNAAEFAFLQAQVNYNITQALYLRTIGTLLQYERISFEQYCESYLPDLQIQRLGPENGREAALRSSGTER